MRETKRPKPVPILEYPPEELPEGRLAGWGGWDQAEYATTWRQKPIRYDEE